MVAAPASARTGAPPPALAAEAGGDGRPAERAGRGAAGTASVALPVLGAVALSQTWFRPGRFIAGGDIPPFVRVALEDELWSAWNHGTTGAGSTSFQIVRAPEVLVIDAVAALGGGEVAAQRVFYGLLLGLVALGGVLFARRFTRRPAAVGLAGTFTVLNLFVLTQVPNPLTFAALAVAGIAGALVVEAAQGGPARPMALAAATVGLSYLLSNPPVFAVTVAWLALLAALGTPLGGPGGGGRAIRLCMRALPWAVVFNLWWLAPAVLTFVGEGASEVGTVTDVRAWAWTHARSSLANVLTLNAGWPWPYPEYSPFSARLDRPGWAWLRLLPVFAVFAAPLLARPVMRRPAVVLLSVALGLVLLAKGLHGPLADANLWAYDHVPGLWLLREPFTKVGVPLVLLYSALVAVASAGLLARTERRDRRVRLLGRAALAGGAVGLVALPHPLWTGGAVPAGETGGPSSHVSIPAGWDEAASFLDRTPERGKVLVLPLADYYQGQTTWGYHGVDVIPSLLLRRTTIQPVPEGYFLPDAGFLALVRGVERSLLERRPEAVPAMLRSLGVGHVVVRRDLERAGAGERRADPLVLAASLQDVSSLRQVRSFPVADVYELEPAVAGPVQIRYPEGGGDGVRVPSWRSAGPARYSVGTPASGAPFTLVLTETFDRGWRLSGLPDGASASHVRVDGYANGWYIEGARGELRLAIEHGPSQLARVALAVSVLAVPLAAATAVAGVVRRRRTAAPRRPTGPGAT